MPSFIESFLWIEFANKFFFIYYVAAHEPNLGHVWKDNLTHPMLISPFYQFFTWVHQEHCENVGCLRLAECFLTENLLVKLQYLGHWATLCRPIAIYVSNSVTTLVVKFSWLTKIIFQIFWVFFLKLEGELALTYESYADGILVILIDYLFYLTLAGNNEPFTVTPFTSSG